MSFFFLRVTSALFLGEGARDIIGNRKKERERQRVRDSALFFLFFFLLI